MKIRDLEGRALVRLSLCSSCHTEILWAVTDDDERMPVNTWPSIEGNVRLDLEAPNIVHARIVPDATPDMFDSTDSGLRYLPHFATCPHADEWRRS